ncbi:hypothetical protein H740_05700 [Campylobacter showae CC57C]|uniref:Uncharacterized protein n=1 Tax=Campylobacter showae CC57C TaxID=1073353 RepID=M3I1X6_9BACT|nr:hypothetical protein H740_05700 [Campylobacter showae CC57C]
MLFFKLASNRKSLIFEKLYHQKPKNGLRRAVTSRKIDGNKFDVFLRAGGYVLDKFDLRLSRDPYRYKHS